MFYPSMIFNSPASAMLNTTPYGMFNVQTNLMWETMRTNQYLFMMPNPMAGGYPFMQNYGLNMPDPKEWAKQMWDMRPDYLKNPQFFFNNMPGVNTNNNINNPSSTASRKDREYQQIRTLLQNLKKDGNVLTEDEEDAVDEALKKSGNIDEKLEAVKEALKTVSENPKVKDAIAKTALSDKDIKTALYLAGYTFGKGSHNVDNNLHTTDSAHFRSNDTIEINAQNAISALRDFKGEKTELAAVDTVLGGCADGATSKDILIDLGHLNREANTEGGFIGMLVKAYDKCKNDDSKTAIKACLRGAHDSLLKQTELINTNTIGEDLKEKFNKAKSELKSSYSSLTETDDSMKDSGKRTKYINNFNNLYKIVRLIQAKKIDNDIKDKYSYLNKTVEGIIPEDIVVEDTKAMLKEENIGDVDNIDVSEVTGKTAGGTVNSSNTPTSSNPAKAKADSLKSGYLSAETSIGTDVYSTKNDYTTSTPKTYYVVQDEKLIELKGAVRYINGKFQMNDGSKKTLAELTEANKNNADVSEQSIKDSVNFKKKIADYINTSEKLTEEDPKGSNGEAILADQSGTRTFVIIENDLFEIDGCDVDDLESASSIVFENGKAKIGSVTKDLKKITNWDVINNL